MDENTKEKLEGCLLGHVTRRKLVHWLRRDYERIVSEIQALAETENLPLASEVITWPKENTLCLPRFVAPCKLDEDVLTVTASLPDPVLSDDDCDSHLQCDIYPPSTNNPSNTEDTAVCIPTVKGVVFPELPKSREGLLELRAQLSMELLWVKQAIASRQEYLVYKKQLTLNTS